MNQNLHQAGVKLLNAMSNHADLIMEAYFSGAVAEGNFSPKVIKNLVDAKVLWRPDDDVQLRLRPSLRTLLQESLKDEHSRQIDANLGTAIASLKTLAENYKEAIAYNHLHESESFLSDLTENVYGITESLTTNVRLLWGRINNEFGYVASVDAKIRENELAQAQVTELRNQLELFSFDELSQVAGSHRQLRNLLVVTLQSAFANCLKELSLVQGRLRELLGRFREFRGRTRLLKGFKLLIEQRPDFVPVNYANLTKVPTLFNQSTPVIQPASVNVFDTDNEALLQEMVAKIKAVHHLRQSKPQRQAENIKVEAQDDVSIDENLLKQQVEAYFCEVIDSGDVISALDYHHKQALGFDPEVWIYQVIGGYQGLPEAEREHFEIGTTGEYHPIYTGNFIIRDVELGFK